MCVPTFVKAEDKCLFVSERERERKGDRKMLVERQPFICSSVFGEETLSLSLSLSLSLPLYFISYAPKLNFL